MKSIIISTSLIILSLTSCNTAFGQWQASSNGVFSAISYCFLEASDGSILTGTSNGIYRSTSSGDDWNLSSTGIPSNDGTILSLAKNDNRLFAGTRESVYYSDDNGVSWSLSESFGFSVFGLEVLSNQIFTGTMGAGVFKSTDNGASWTNANTGMSDSIYSLLVNGNDLLAGTYGDGIYLSNDQGATWNQEFSQSNPTIVRTLAATSTRIFAGISQLITPTAQFNSLHRSSNNGQSWSMYNYSGLPTPGNLPITALFASESTLLLASSGQIYLSSDDGINWFTLMGGFTATAPYGITCLEETSNYIFCGVEAGGAGPVFRIPKNQVLTSVNSLESDVRLNLFPNPSDGAGINLDYHFKRILNQKWLIYDASGRLLFEKQLEGSDGHLVLQLPLEPGTYISAITNSNGLVKTESLVVTH